MLFSNLVTSFACLVSVVSAIEYKFYNKRTDFATPELFKRDFLQITDGISISTSAVGLTSTVVVNIDYTYNISIAGYVVSPNFDIDGGDYGYTVVTEYNDADDLLENLDKWQFIHVADNGLRTLLTPDCSNTFTLLNSDSEILTWDVCYPITSLTDDFSYLLTGSSTPTETGTGGAGAGTETATGTTVYNTGTVIVNEGTTTTATAPCPVCTGEPTTYFIFTETETISGVETLTVTVPCSTKTGYPITEPIGAPVYTAYVTVENGATVTKTVACGCAAGGTAAPSLTTDDKGDVYTVVPTSAEGTTTYYKTVTTDVAPAGATTSTGAGEGAATGGEGAATGGEGAATGGEGAATGGEGAATGGEGAATGGEGATTGTVAATSGTAAAGESGSTTASVTPLMGAGSSYSSSSFKLLFSSIAGFAVALVFIL